MVNYIPRSNFAYKLQRFEGCFMRKKEKQQQQKKQTVPSPLPSPETKLEINTSGNVCRL